MANQCTKCGRLTPQMAEGFAKKRQQSDRLSIYEGVAAKAFTYKADSLCMVCRHGGTRGTLSSAPGAGEALKQWLVKTNERR